MKHTLLSGCVCVCVRCPGEKKMNEIKADVFSLVSRAARENDTHSLSLSLARESRHTRRHARTLALTLTHARGARCGGERVGPDTPARHGDQRPTGSRTVGWPSSAVGGFRPVLGAPHQRPRPGPVAGPRRRRQGPAPTLAPPRGFFFRTVSFFFLSFIALSLSLSLSVCLSLCVPSYSFPPPRRSSFFSIEGPLDAMKNNKENHEICFLQSLVDVDDGSSCSSFFFCPASVAQSKAKSTPYQKKVHRLFRSLRHSSLLPKQNYLGFLFLNIVHYESSHFTVFFWQESNGLLISLTFASMQTGFRPYTQQNDEFPH